MCPTLEQTSTGIVIGAIVTAAFAGLVALVNAWAKNRREDRAQRGDEANVIIERQEKQIVRLERTLEDHQGIVTRIVERHTACREENAELRAWANMARGRWEECRNSCEVGRKFPALPPVPPPRPRLPEDAEFLARTAAQDVELARGVNERLAHPRPPRGVKGPADRRPPNAPEDLGGVGT